MSETRSWPTEQDVLQSYRAHLSKGRATIAELFGCHMETSSTGAWLRTRGGQQFLNCGGYGVFLMGARHPKVMERVRRQLEEHPQATRILLEPSVAAAAEKLTSVMPPGLERVHFATSGAEAVETGLKLARAHGRRRLVAMSHGYHGKTLGALSATAKDVYRTPFRPLLPDVTHVPFGELFALESVLAEFPAQCTVLVEPVQGEGGVVIPSPGYLKGLVAACRQHGALLIADEVQTGMGRLGHWWGINSEGVVPDILLAGKALGGGVAPVSAAIAREEIFAPFDKDPYMHTGTFSGAPLLMAAVEGAIEAIEEDDLIARARDLGRQLLPALTQIVSDRCSELVVEVRGRGLLIGVEFVEPGTAGEFLLELFNHGLVGNHSMDGSATIRLTPPAILTSSDVEYLLAGFDQAAAALMSDRVTMPRMRTEV